MAANTQQNIPKLRFPMFIDELRCGKLNEFGYFYYGKSAPKFSVKKDAKTPCIRYGELYTVYSGEINKIRSFTDIDSKKLIFSKGGEVLIPRVGEDPLDFIKCSYLTIPNVAVGEMISVYNTNEDGLFITYYISAMLKKEFARVVEGANVSNLYFRYLEKINIIIPNQPEQKKIVIFLKTISQQLENLKEQKKSFESYKKGMMQKIFAQEIRFKDNNGKEFEKWKEKKLGDVAEFWNGKAHEQEISDNGKYVVINSKFVSTDGRIKKYSDKQNSPLNKDDIAIVMSDILTLPQSLIQFFT